MEAARTEEGTDLDTAGEDLVEEVLEEVRGYNDLAGVPEEVDRSLAEEGIGRSPGPVADRCSIAEAAAGLAADDRNHLGDSRSRDIPDLDTCRSSKLRIRLLVCGIRSSE